jgi:large subunit ribosomal protein L16
MGLRKGFPKYLVFVVKLNRILYEMCGVPENVAKATMKIATCKMPIHTQFVTFYIRYKYE